MNSLPIFETTTSALYYSNDGLLHVVKATHPDDQKPSGERLELARTIWNVVRVPDAPTVEIDAGEVVFTTLDRVKADAFIAGYDAREQ